MIGCLEPFVTEISEPRDIFEEAINKKEKICMLAEQR